jgi:hypothetical protein
MKVGEDEPRWERKEIKPNFNWVSKEDSRAKSMISKSEKTIIQ